MYTSHPLCELSPASPGRTSCTHCSQLFCWPRGVGLWSPVQHLCMHNSERQGDQWEMGATGGILLSSSPRGLFWAAISTHSWGWFYEVTWTFVLRTPFPPFCSSGISFSRQSWKSLCLRLWGLQVKTSSYYAPRTLLDSWDIAAEFYHPKRDFMILMRNVKTQIILLGYVQIFYFLKYFSRGLCYRKKWKKKYYYVLYDI